MEEFGGEVLRKRLKRTRPNNEPPELAVDEFLKQKLEQTNQTNSEMTTTDWQKFEQIYPGPSSKLKSLFYSSSFNSQIIQKNSKDDLKSNLFATNHTETVSFGEDTDFIGVMNSTTLSKSIKHAPMFYLRRDFSTEERFKMGEKEKILLINNKGIRTKNQLLFLSKNKKLINSRTKKCLLNLAFFKKKVPRRSQPTTRKYIERRNNESKSLEKRKHIPFLDPGWEVLHSPQMVSRMVCSKTFVSPDQNLPRPRRWWGDVSDPPAFILKKWMVVDLEKIKFLNKKVFRNPFLYEPLPSLYLEWMTTYDVLGRTTLECWRDNNLSLWEQNGYFRPASILPTCSDLVRQLIAVLIWVLFLLFHCEVSVTYSIQNRR